MLVVSMLNVLLTNTDLDVNVLAITLVIHTSSATRYLMTTVTATMRVLSAKFATEIDALEDVETMATANLKKLASTKFVKIHATFTELVASTLFAKQLTTIVSALVYLNSLANLRVSASESNHHLNVQLTTSVSLDKFAAAIDVSLAVEPLTTVLMNNPASRTNVSTLVPFPVPVEGVQLAHRPITSLFARVQVDSVAIQMLNVAKFHPNVEVMTSADWKRFASNKNASLDVELTPIVPMTKLVSTAFVNLLVTSVACAALIPFVDPKNTRPTALVLLVTLVMH